MELMRTHCVETADRLIGELILNKEGSIQNAVDFSLHNMRFIKICIDLKPHVIEAGFDLIPDNLINGIITENGLINGEEITDYLNRHKKES